MALSVIFMAQKLWSGAFEGANADALAFNSAENIELDGKLVAYDLLGSIAHVKMLAKQKIIPVKEAGEITKALSVVLSRYNSGQFTLDPSLEDVHTNVEAAVSNLTPAGKTMHTARSRNDQVLLDMRMYMRDEALELAYAAIQLQKAFVVLAKQDGPMVGYTHTRVAQPITISFWCEAQVQSLGRDIDRLLQFEARFNQNPLGAGALAGSGWPVDREYTAKLLGFASVQKNALDAISSRGEAEGELLAHLSILMGKLSGLSEELIWLSQMKLIQIPDEFCTGSSMMPNKKNPDVLELIRGRASRVQGNLVHCLGVKKGLMSGYHSDHAETKYAVMMGVDTTKGSLQILASLVPSLTFNSQSIEAELESGYAQATEVADALAHKGVPFREAHGMVGKLVGECQTAGISLSKATPIPPLNSKEWAEATQLERTRLKVKVELDASLEKKVVEEKKKIQKTFEQLIR